MNSDHLYKHSKPYNILKGITSLYHSVYYEEICVLNEDNIPDGDPVIFTPNHQNALMDALAIIYTTKKQPVFMARADIFEKDTVKKILTFLKIIPVYRIRDGIEALSFNDQSFETTFQVLKHGGAVGIMPEGNHGEQHRLRPLKKGVARLAIQAQELLDTKTSIKIVPVGVEYSTYQGFRGCLVVNYGNPIDVKDFLPEYKANAAKGLQSIRSRLTNEMKSLMIDIASDQYYATIYEAKELYSYSKKDELETYCDKFLLDKKLSDNLVKISTQSSNEMELLRKKLRELNHACAELKISPWVFSWKAPEKTQDRIWDVSRYVFFFPIAVWVTLFHAIPYYASELYSNKVQDKQFVSSMRFVVSFIMYLVWYLIFLLIPFSILFKAILVIAMPLLGLISFDYWDSLKKAKVKVQYFLLIRQNSKALKNAESLHAEIIQWLSAKIA